jgi:hypothetical protein
MTGASIENSTSSKTNSTDKELLICAFFNPSLNNAIMYPINPTNPNNPPSEIDCKIML